MKRIIRLTESDLTRIVRRVIRESEEESWTDEDQSEWDDIRSKGPYLKDFDNDYSKWEPEFEKWKNNPRYKELGDKMSRIRRKKEEDRYSNVVSNRPEDFDVDSYNDEYFDLDDKISDREKSFPRLQKGEDAMAFGDKLRTYTGDAEYRSMINRKSELRKHLDRDFNTAKDTFRPRKK